MNVVISETTKARELGLGMQIQEITKQRKFIFWAMCYAHKPHKTVAPTILMLENQI